MDSVFSSGKTRGGSTWNVTKAAFAAGVSSALAGNEGRGVGRERRDFSRKWGGALNLGQNYIFFFVKVGMGEGGMMGKHGLFRVFPNP